VRLTSYLPRWKANNRKKSDGESISNKELSITLTDKVQLMKDRKIGFTMQWVKGHAGHCGNMLADYMATRGVFCGRHGDENHIQIKDAAEHEK
ncbi:hypothetical protein DDB_G0294298, partial [Dictyostelium discoideum AX4]